MATVNYTATVVTSAVKLDNKFAFTTPQCRPFLRFSSPSLRRFKFTPLTATKGEETKSTGAADVLESAKALAESTKAAVIEQGDEVKSKLDEAADENKANVIEQGDNVADTVFGAIGDALDSTKTAVNESVDDAQGALDSKDKK